MWWKFPSGATRVLQCSPADVSERKVDNAAFSQKLTPAVGSASCALQQRRVCLEMESMDSCSRADSSGEAAVAVVRRQERWARSFRELCWLYRALCSTRHLRKAQLSKACVCPGVRGATSPVLRRVRMDMRAVCTTTGTTCRHTFLPFPL